MSAGFDSARGDPKVRCLLSHCVPRVEENSRALDSSEVLLLVSVCFSFSIIYKGFFFGFFRDFAM